MRGGRALLQQGEEVDWTQRGEAHPPQRGQWSRDWLQTAQLELYLRLQHRRALYRSQVRFHFCLWRACAVTARVSD